MRACDIDGMPCVFNCARACMAIQALKNETPAGTQWQYQQNTIDRAQREEMSDGAPETDV
jgi:hypothetical protein